MTVEVWSDVMCPFCYIGKRHYEEALAQFADNQHVEIEWKSFQLDPSVPEHFEEKPDLYQYLAERKGISVAQSRQMHDRVVEMAQNAGLTYNFDQAVVANSFKAHRVIQMAKSQGLGDAMEERLFKAYFTEGKDFGAAEILLELGKEIGLSENQVQEALQNEAYSSLVMQDIEEARHLGISGVPFFVFNRQYAVSGAQAATLFLEVMQKAYASWRKAHPILVLDAPSGAQCSLEEGC
ncbi:MAG: DsbA family oxidoreductase [Bacteroidetes bacterium]|nr:DsbA family oxidoreductase [Bacteroidota bacterium]